MAGPSNSSYAAVEANKAIQQALSKAESIHGELTKKPFLVTDNGTSFLAKWFQEFISDGFQHVRIQYRTPTQRGLLERFHKTLKTEEVYSLRRWARKTVRSLLLLKFSQRGAECRLQAAKMGQQKPL